MERSSRIDGAVIGTEWHFSLAELLATAAYDAVHMRGPFSYFLLYVALYGAFGVASPFWPKYFESRSLTSEQIAMALGAGLLVRLAAGPAAGLLADRLQSMRLVLAVCAGLAATAASALSSASSFQVLFILIVLQAAALAPTTSLADGLAVHAAKAPGARFKYGWLRGSASAAFVFGTLIIGQLIHNDDFTPVVWMNVALLTAAGAAAALVPGTTAQHQPKITFWQLMYGVRELLNIPSVRSVFIVSALVFGSHAMHDAFAVIRWSNAGLEPRTISFLWSEAVAAEVIVFFVIGPAFLDRFGPRSAACVAAVAGILRWSIAGVTTSVAVLAVLQPLHGLTFALLHLACMGIMGAVVPIRISATAQSFYAFGSGLATALLTLLSGGLYARYGGAAFFPMAVLCIAALLVAWFNLKGVQEEISKAP